MPLYTLSTDSPIQADRGQANTDTVEFEEPVLTEAEIFISEDAYTEVKAGLFVGDRRIVPDPNGDPVQKPGTTGPVPVDVRLPGVPGDIRLEVWAPDADFQHRVVANVEARDAVDRPQPVRVVGVGNGQFGRRPTPSAEDLRDVEDD